jgi:hypothetical protein
MKGLQIFMHSVRQVLGNLVPALQLSAVLYGVQVVIVSLLGGGGMGASPGEGPNVVLALIAGLVVLITGLWIAVGWHRYVLLNEQPSIVPPVHMDRLVAYLIKMVIIIVILIIPALAVGVIAAPFSQKALFAGPFVFAVFSGVLALPLIVLFLLFSAALPGTAVGGQSGLNAAWYATKGDIGSIIVVALLLSAMSVVFDLLAFYVFSMIPMGLLLWGIVSGWVKTMVGISVITTLYGHYVENRALS